MELELTFPVRQEKHSVRLLKPSGMEVFLDFPVWVSHLNGSTDKVRYDQVEEQKDGTCLANALIRARNGNEYELCDLWRVEENCVTVERRFPSFAAVGRLRYGSLRILTALKEMPFPLTITVS